MDEKPSTPNATGGHSQASAVRKLLGASCLAFMVVATIVVNGLPLSGHGGFEYLSQGRIENEYVGI